MTLEALIFDCDGVLVDTEKDGHRVAFNQAFAAMGLDVQWDVELYGELLAVAGGKERMAHYFTRAGWPDAAADRDAFIRKLHTLKTDRFMSIIASGGLPLRPGVARLIDEAIAAGITLAVCSTSNERAVHLVVDTLLGPRRKAAFGGIFAGDMVPRKKPDPAVYQLACRTLGLSPAACVVVEDSANGLRAAKAAGMPCLVTVSTYTAAEDFSAADRVVAHLDDGPITLADLRALVKA
ncbi:MAG: HAD-IA family hydrolase [Planctomycetes bacterium]|nr:HAD-IA family hydrolase [Planctomycetota bacterium]